MRRALWTTLGLAGALILTLMAFGIDVRSGLMLIYDGAFGDKSAIARTLVRTSPLLLCGLGMAIAWRAGMYNVGGEGQYVLGGVAGAAIAKTLINTPSALGIAAILFSSALAGSLLSTLAGWLQVKRGVQCVISTILLNFVVVQFLAWCVRGPLQESKHQLPLSDRLPKSLMFPRPDPQTDLHLGLAITGLVLVTVAFLLPATKFGFLVKVVGESPAVARSNRFDAGRIQLAAMAVSGALCGLAAGIDFTGLIGQIGDGFSQNWGFLSIPVALLGNLNPWGVLGSSLYFGALIAGGEGLARFNATGTTLVYVIQAVAVLGLITIGQKLGKKTPEPQRD